MDASMLFALALAVLPATGEAQAVTAELLEQELRITVAGLPFAGYRWGDDLKYPYFWPVNGPLSGKSLTTESSEPYPHHHSLWLACDRVNGANFWQEGLDRGRIVSHGARVVWATADAVVFRDTCTWEHPEGVVQLRDLRKFRIRAPSPECRVIDATFLLTAATDVHIERSNHSLFAARMIPELSVQAGGVLVNAEGATGEQGTYGQRSAWCDYSGMRDGVTEGLAIFDHPDNPWYPCQWFTRDYGFFSPTPLQWSDGIRLAAGESLTLRYRVLIHAGDAAQADVGRYAP